MSTFPQTPHFTGLNRPLTEEYDFDDLVVDGTLPAEVEGTFFRAIPNPTFAPFIEDPAIALSPDGMVAAIRFRGGKVSAAIRYVETPRHLAEKAAGRALFGKYRNPFTDMAETKGIDRAVVNTTPVFHGGRLLMTKEDSLAYQVDPETLETVGRFDFGGRLKSQTFTAHTRIDGKTGEMFFFGYEAEGLATRTVSYGYADKAGNLVREQMFEVPYAAMMHDFTVTENYALFPIYPTKTDLERLKAGGDHWIHDQEEHSWLGVMPRYGDVSEMKWFKGPKGVYSFHMFGAFEDADGNIHMDQCIGNSALFYFIREASGIFMHDREVGHRVERWTVRWDGAADVQTAVVGPPGDFPVIPAAQQGYAYDHAWMLTFNPQRTAPPVVGGVGNALFDTLLRIDFTGKPPQAFTLPANGGFNEPVHVPSREPGHEGWLLAVADFELSPESSEHACLIFNAGDVAAGPVAKVILPRRQRPQIHGCWVSTEKLATAN